jgi:hypothetical protein
LVRGISADDEDALVPLFIQLPGVDIPLLSRTEAAHVIPAEASLGFEAIVLCAKQSEVVQACGPAAGEGNDMVELKHMRRAAPNSGGSNERALTAISRVNGIANVDGNVPLWRC